MGAIGLNPIRLDRIGLDPIRINAIKLGVPGASGSDRPYIDPEVLASLKAVCICYGKSNDDPDRAVVKNLVDPDNPFVISNAAYTEGSGYADKGSPYYGAFVTDGIDDLITSTKTVQEMLGGSSEYTVLSMIHHIDVPEGNIHSNTVRIKLGSWGTSNGITSFSNNKTGIYGYTVKNQNITVINNILGDKNDYGIRGGDYTSNLEAKFSVIGWIGEDDILRETASIAWYWTIIANKVLTTDQINQVIAYFNLDRTLNPDILCNTIKQGITNENHAEFGDKLIDFSGNGRDIQLNNIAWNKDSGIGKYGMDFLEWKSNSDMNFTSTKLTSTKPNLSSGWLTFRNVSELISETKVKVSRAPREFVFIGNNNGTDDKFSVTINNGVYTIPEFTLSSASGFYINNNSGDWSNLVIEQIPSHAGALCLDGINDFGKVTGMPIYKDYTVIADYIRTSAKENAQDSPILSKSQVVNNGAFVFNYLNINSALNSYSFGTNNGLESISDSERKIYYQSKYVNDGKSINSGTGIDYNSMWLGTYRDNVQIFFNGAIYSLMSFPYSMSKFLIERQLKKHKLGTLYPDMAEFRPIVESNVKYQDIIFRNTSTGENLIVGQYYNLESISIYVKPLYYEKVSTIKVNNINAEFNSYDKNSGYYRFDCIVTKSPQKINLTIEQDENYVLFNPIITSNVEYHKLDFYLNNYEKRINIGDYIPKDAYLRADFYLKNNVDELTVFTFNGVDIDYKRSIVDDTAFNIGSIYNYDSPQEVNITIDEYIRYEDIVQPYPVLLRFKDESGKEVSWGDKIKVGSSITRIGSFNDCNLLKGIYTVSNAKLNGSPLPSTPHVVEKSMVFTCTATWAFDNNEPKCILSPRLLRIPNSSYKILGHIPDISGHGNHGKINNSAYASMSGANGYLLDFKTFTTGNSSLVNIKDDSRIEVININKEKSTTWVNLNKSTSISLSSWKIKVTGMKSGDTLGYYYSESTDATLRSKFDIKSDGIYSLPSSIANSNNIGGIAFDIVAGADSAYRIEQIGKYEGAYCFDGVDDFVTIPTTVGGKQVLMKVNWQKSPTLLYDQRVSGRFAVLTTKEDDAVNSRIAYQGRNPDGKTYIDGIENNNIETYTLKDITHNITIANSSSGGVIVPVIGCNTDKTSSFAKMSLYDFMLFDEISTDDKIKQLNEYVGIEGNTDDLFNETN